ncbi:melanocyte-stimulating hormone receptor-like [Montipora foliosa]|uniref:melanocyte-stimulating hormone receptor-like n=1 Tax=Montipora foliosa TaxID=591990 RepID=UPI0035F143F7
MASANSTSGRTKRSFQNLFCSEDLTAEIHHVFTCLIVINIILSFTAVLGNSLILTALRKETSIHPPSKLLFRCLATTDLLVGLASEPLAVVYWISAISQHWSICYYAFLSLVVTGYALCGMSLITLAAISVDRLFALTFGLRYKQIVTIKRAYATVTTFWLISMAFSAMYVKYELVTTRVAIMITALCLAVSVISYTKIFLRLGGRRPRHRGASQGAEQPSHLRQVSIQRYRKALSTALWLQFVVVMCYSPNGIAVLLSTEYGLTSSMIIFSQIAMTLVFLSSSVAPIFYCWKMKQVWIIIKATLKCANSGVTNDRMS